MAAAANPKEIVLDDHGDTNPEGTARAAPVPRLDYHVVFKTLTGISTGVMTRTMFDDQASFERWYDGAMRDGTNRPLREVYAVVAQGVPDSDAAWIIASPENTDAVIRSYVNEAISHLRCVR